MTTTPRLGLTQLEEGQALPESVVNEADLILEMFATRLIVLSQGDNSPAGGEVDGDAYLVGSSGTGAFIGHDDELALYINGAWSFVTPKEGMEIEVLDEDTSYTFRGGSWVGGGSGGALDDLSDVNAPTPSDGDVLAWDSTPGEWVPVAPSVGGGGDIEFIGRTTVTTLSTVDIPLSATYDSFYIEFYFTFSTDNVDLRARVSEDNFSTVKSGASDYAHAILRHGTSTGFGQSSAAAQIQLSTAQGNAAGEYSAGRLDVINAKETAPTTVVGSINYVTTAGLYSGAHVVADYHGTTNAVNGLQFSVSSGTVTGFYKIWGRLA